MADAAAQTTSRETKPGSNAMRLADGGVALDRSQPVRFRFNGEQLSGYKGDTLASALIAAGRHFVGRSFKYHRPRGFVASGVEEPNALFGIGVGEAFEPNQRGTMVELYEGLAARSQNHFPSLEYDIGALNAYAARMLPAGFYYKTFLQPRAAWKHVFEPFIRRAAGLGRAPTEADHDTYEHFYASYDVVVAGGGLAGLLAARAAAAGGARVALFEQGPQLGGRALVDPGAIEDPDGGTTPIAEYVERLIAELEAAENVTIRTRLQVSAQEDHGYLLGYERVSDHDPSLAGPRHRLWRVRAGRLVVATGAIERPVPFAYNDLPGVMLAGAMRDYVGLYAAKPGARAVVFANNDDAYRTALALHAAGVEVAAIVDSRPRSGGDLPQRCQALGMTPRFGAVISKAIGKKRVEAAEISEVRGSGRPGAPRKIECDAIAMSGGWSPAVHLWSHCGGKLRWDEAALMFRPDPAHAPQGADGEAVAICAGRANGHVDWAEIAVDGTRAGIAAAAAVGKPAANPPAAPRAAAMRSDRIQPLWFAPAHGREANGHKHFIDYQNDVTAADVELAAREGYESVEHAKRYTTLGMATDQGKLSNINGLAILADARGAAIPEVGTTTFRPPYTPISFGSIAGSAKGELFKPVRRTPMHALHEGRGAVWEPVGDWRRPYAFPQRSGARPEDVEEAVNREILTVREKAGMLDASTLGKIIVAGPDAPEFLDLVYTNMMSSLKVGRCRYGLMCNDNGYLFDDGVAARLSEEKYLLHTTSGGADNVHAWLEEWLQTEWHHLQVFTANVTEQYAQIAVAGPKAREVLQALEPSMDLSAEALPFMSFVDGRLAGCPARVYRISFSGELSYEIATPAAFGRSLWEAIAEAGEPHGITPYGTEALHVMRAEKGFIMIGDETDGTVTPLDLNMGWAVSKKKTDFIGRRAMQRPFLMDPDRKRLVGLLTEAPTDVLPHAAHAVEGVREDGKPQSIGHVTSSYWSPTLRRSIAMALIRRGPERMGETLEFSVEKDRVIRAKVVDPVFYDPDNARQAV